MRKATRSFLLTDCAERPSPQPLGLDVVGLEPEGLQLGMIVRAEGMALQDPVELLELAPVEGDDRLGLEHALMPVQPGARRQRPEESAEPLHGACLLENLDIRHHRLEDDRQGGHTVSRQNSSRVSSYSSVSCISRIHLSLYLSLFLSVSLFLSRSPRSRKTSRATTIGD